LINVDDAAMGFGSVAPLITMPYSVSMPSTFTMATGPTLSRAAPLAGEPEIEPEIRDGYRY
jgi:hypothetical protein